MRTFQIAVLVGSLRRDSINRKLAKALEGLAPSGFVFRSIRFDDLPLYNQDEVEPLPEPVKRIKSEIRESQGVLFVTPEYNRSIPGGLKNAIDQASRPYGQSAWQGKPAGVIGASTGKPGTSMAQQHLRSMLAYLDMPTLGQPEAFIHVTDGFFDENGGLANADTRKFLQTWMDRYVEWVQKHAA